MKFSQKMMLVPASRPAPEISELSALDQAMSNSLNNRSISNVEKLNLYKKVLRKNLAMETNLKQKFYQQENLENSNEDLSNLDSSKFDSIKLPNTTNYTSKSNDEDEIDYVDIEEIIKAKPEIKQELIRSYHNDDEYTIKKKNTPEKQECQRKWMPYCLRDKKTDKL